jgi:GT2 family glycosyltransferase
VTACVSAILVNYNGGPELRAALQSIADELSGVSWEGFVVDNHSTDGSQAVVQEFASTTKLIQNEANIGFSRAVNQGIAAASAPLVLIMNPDCLLTPGALAVLRGEIEAFENCAIVGPRILNPDGSVQGSARGDPNMLTGLFGRTTMLRRLMPDLPVSRRNVIEGAERDGRRSIVVDWLSGACMLARRAALESVGGFDERYFLYWEDADLCRRLRARGYQIRYAPVATAVHRVGHSSRGVRAAAIRAFHESAYTYYATHVAPGQFRLRRVIARLLLAGRCRMHLLLDAWGRSGAYEPGPATGPASSDTTAAHRAERSL